MQVLDGQQYLLLSPRFGRIGDPRVHDHHRDVAQDRGDDGQRAVEERHTHDHRVVIGADRLHKESADAGDRVDPLHHDGAGQRPDNRARDTVGDRDRGVFEDEFYARDTSRKIRSVFKSKGMSGKHLTGTVIYGYLWDEKREHWLVDEEAAEVVRRIL